MVLSRIPTHVEPEKQGQTKSHMKFISTIHQNGMVIVLAIVAVAIIAFGLLIWFKSRRRPSRLADFRRHVTLLESQNGHGRAPAIWDDGDHVIRYYGGAGMTRKEFHACAVSSLERHIEWLEQKKRFETDHSDLIGKDDAKAIGAHISALKSDLLKLIRKGDSIPDDPAPAEARVA
jgi:hypothetical protein